jgi:hypothetical protein
MSAPALEEIFEEVAPGELDRPACDPHKPLFGPEEPGEEPRVMDVCITCGLILSSYVESLAG